MKRSIATRTSCLRIAISRARTICSSFSISIQPRTVFLVPTPPSSTALRLRPDSAEAHFARADYLFRCNETTTALWKNSRSHGRVCRTARRFLFSPATSIAGATIFTKPSATSLPLSRSIREIRMPIIFWPTPTCSNAGFLNQSTSMTTSLPPASKRQSSGTDAPHPSCTELPTLGRSARF